MKNKILFIVPILILIVVSIFIAIVVNNKKDANEISGNTVNTAKTDVVINNGWVEVNNTTINDKNIVESSFKGYLKQEWQNMITKFYKEHNKKDIKTVICEFNDDKKYTAEVYTNDDKLLAKYIFNDDTGYAEDVDTGITIDFVNSKIVEQLKKDAKIFENNLNCLAIGYVKFDTESKFIEKYFKNEASYNSVTRYDFREETERANIPQDKIIFIPRTDDTEISIYRCNIDNEGKIVVGEMLIDRSTEMFSFVLGNDETTTPKYMVKVKLTDLEKVFELAFSGENGKLVLTDDIMDISIY